MMNCPSFSDFIRSIDQTEYDYDLQLYSTDRMKNQPIPFTEDQTLYMVDLITTLIETALSHYHKWLFEYLSKMEGGKE